MAGSDWLACRWERALTITDRAVGWIAIHKLELLAGSIALAGVLAVCGVVMWILGDGGELNKVLLDAGGYLAVAAIVVGLPALAYAMVTDRSVDALTASQQETMRNAVEQLIGSADKALERWGYDVQLYTPTSDRVRLIPTIDPSAVGPKEGFRIDSQAPQGVTGSAWVANEYFCTQHAPRDLDLRLDAHQQNQLRTITHVAAAPVTDVAGRPIAVVTVSSKHEKRNVTYEDLSRMVVGLADEVGRRLRAYIGPLNFASVSAEKVGDGALGESEAKDALPGFRFRVTDKVVRSALDSKAFSDLSEEMKRRDEG